MDPDVHETGTPKDFLDGLALVVVVLKEKETPGSKCSGRTFHDLADLPEAIRATIKGQQRFMQTDDRIKCRKPGRGDVRGIGNNQGEPPPV